MRARGANPIVYGIVRVSFQIFFLIYFRMQRIGLEHIPKRGPVIIAANHRSFLDPFVIACMARRPMYYVAKQEIFVGRVISWLLTSLGAFPVRRGASDAETIVTAKAILERGDIVLIFPEGTRTRPGALGTPRRGVGRLALETGAPVVPVAVIGTEAIRKGVLIRPHKVRMRAGRALRFPTVEQPSPALAGAVTERIWPCVMLQWEWLGGLAPIRRIAVIGAGAWGTALATLLARAGFEVELGCRTKEQAEAIAETRVNDRYLPGVELPDQLRVLRASELNLEGHDLVCLAVPATALPAVLAAHGGQITRRLGMLVAGSGLVAPFGTLPAAFAAAALQRSRGRRARRPGAAPRECSSTAARSCSHRGTGDSPGSCADMLRAAQLDVTVSSDVAGVQLAGCGDRVAALAAEAAVTAGPTSPAPPPARCSRRSPRSRERQGREARDVRRAGRRRRPGRANVTAAELAAAARGRGGRHRRRCWPVARRARHSCRRRRWMRWPRSCEGRIEPAQWQNAISEPSTQRAAGLRGPLEQGM